MVQSSGRGSGQTSRVSSPIFDSSALMAVPLSSGLPPADDIVGDNTLIITVTIKILMLLIS